jgi:hypothetical protein
MYTISADLKDALRSEGNEFEAYITDNDTITIAADDDLVELELTAQGNYGKTVMRELSGKWNGNYDLLGKYINAYMGGHIPDVTNKGAVTISIATPAVVTLTAHGLLTGDRVRFTTDGALPTGITAGTDYYVIKVTDNTFNIATTYENAFNGVKVATTGTQSGTHTLFYYPVSFGSTIEYVSYGSFKVVETAIDDGSTETSFKAYDKMYEALKVYALSLDFSAGLAILEVLQAICTELGWTLGAASFVNDTISFDSDPFTDQGLTYRDVLEDIAEASGTIAMFNEDDELILKARDVVVDTLTGDDLMASKFEPEWAELNSVVLSRVEVDNIVEQDATSIATYGLHEYKIVDNLVVDGDRATYITPLYNELLGLRYYPCEVDAFGTIYLEVGDLVSIQDPDDIDRDVLITRIVTKGFNVYIEAKAPDLTSTDYKTAGVIGKAIKNTEIKVDKQEGRIELLVDDVASLTISTEGIQLTAQTALDQAEANAASLEDVYSEITTLQQSVDGLEISVSGIGGSNLFKNSVGLKGTIEEWKEDTTEARNDATIDTSTNVRENTEAQSGLSLNDQYVKQTVPTIIGERYVLYCKFYKNGTLTAAITGVPIITMTGNTNEWTVFKYDFIATGITTSVTFDTTGLAVISDIVMKTGDVSGWIQAPNEVYGANFRFDKDGFRISSLTDPFVSLLDNQKLAVYDTSSGSDRIVMYVSKDSGIVTKLVAQDDLIIQRYEEPSKAGRFIPTADGVYFTIND